MLRRGWSERSERIYLLRDPSGWNFYSIDDDDAYINNSDNFRILNAKSVFEITPVILEIFNAPYGTDLCWLYREDVHIGFYDLIKEREVTIEEVLKKAN